ncbi:hypothetical protein [Paenibacillus lignilyticus]|uniref:MATH domain-containing protein n=1 Tax=Paenibacillus lignilyticus TaxID=1172615 RepID=A0ABS5CFE9_9BACL|nr:hypothetical protein [Paenibacillus lignilyticus]MBP3964580.1 hypothetical protein [Paenibacillus lignilyticus]
MKKGWFELGKDKCDKGYLRDGSGSSKTWKIHIYSYEDEDDSTPDATLILNKTEGNGNGYFLVELSVTYIGRATMFDEVIALVNKLDALSSDNDSLSLTEHLMVCHEFFDCGRSMAQSNNLNVRMQSQ